MNQKEMTVTCPQNCETNETGEIGKIGEKTQLILFERTRRITGYLVGDKSRFNNAKAREEQDRVKHTATYNSRDAGIV